MVRGNLTLIKTELDNVDCQAHNLRFGSQSSNSFIFKSSVSRAGNANKLKLLTSMQKDVRVSIEYFTRFIK